jgi:hypothetical protein
MHLKPVVRNGVDMIGMSIGIDSSTSSHECCLRAPHLET